MTQVIIPAELAERVRALVDKRDGGDVVRAAHRIGVREADLRAVLEATVDQPKLSVLSALVRGFDVDAWWLITGETELDAELPTERRVDTLNLLSDLSETMTLQRRLYLGESLTREGGSGKREAGRGKREAGRGP